MFDLYTGTHLQRQTGGRIQGLEPPPSLSVELQQVRVVLPAEQRGAERQGVAAAGVQLGAALPPAG